MTDAVIEKLDELIAATKAAAIPVNDRWLDAAGIGALISQEPAYVRQRLAPRPDFPRPNRIGQPRWKASEVLAWMESTRCDRSKPGRRRVTS